MSIYHFIQNICFFLFYVNQVFHTHKMWIMWITLCITLFYGLFLNSHVWKKCVWFSTPFSFFDRICAKCSKFDFHLCSAQKYNKRSHRLLMHSLSDISGQRPQHWHHRPLQLPPGGASLYGHLLQQKSPAYR